MRIAIAVVAVVSLMVAGPAWAATIVVDGDGGGDYLTIQEGVDAAANTDTVLVRPGTYTDVHWAEFCWDYAPVNVFVQKNITLVSSDGPGVTIVDGQGEARFGVVALPDPDIGWLYPPPVVEGFTVESGTPYPSWPSAGIIAIDAEARGNVCTGYYCGLTTDCPIMDTGVPDGGRQRSNESAIIDNLAYENDCGILVRSGFHGDVAATVSGNSVTDNPTGISVAQGWGGTAEISSNTVEGNEVGVLVRAPGSSGGAVTLIGNTISGNLQGVTALSIHTSGSYHRAALSLALEGNQVFDNTLANVRVHAASEMQLAVIDVTIGGSLDAANDFHGAPANVQAIQGAGGQVCIDATYNYWGSTLCSEFVPLFQIVDVPGECFTFLPFTDAPHAGVYEDCESLTHDTSWGRIKALYH